MKISIIAASHRPDSQSKRISHYLKSNLNKLDKTINLFTLDLGENVLPLWTPDKKKGEGVWKNSWYSISDNLSVHGLDI